MHIIVVKYVGVRSAKPNGIVLSQLPKKQVPFLFRFKTKLSKICSKAVFVKGLP